MKDFFEEHGYILHIVKGFAIFACIAAALFFLRQTNNQINNMERQIVSMDEKKANEITMEQVNQVIDEKLKKQVPSNQSNMEKRALDGMEDAISKNMEEKKNKIYTDVYKQIISDLDKAEEEAKKQKEKEEKEKKEKATDKKPTKNNNSGSNQPQQNQQQNQQQSQQGAPSQIVPDGGDSFIIDSSDPTTM